MEAVSCKQRVVLLKQFLRWKKLEKLHVCQIFQTGPGTTAGKLSFSSGNSISPGQKTCGEVPLVRGASEQPARVVWPPSMTTRSKLTTEVKHRMDRLNR